MSLHIVHIRGKKVWEWHPSHTSKDLPCLFVEWEDNVWILCWLHWRSICDLYRIMIISPLELAFGKCSLIFLQHSFLFIQLIIEIVVCCCCFLGFLCRPEDLRRPFGQFGPLKDIYLPRDYYTGLVLPYFYIPWSIVCVVPLVSIIVTLGKLAIKMPTF